MIVGKESKGKYCGCKYLMLSSKIWIYQKRIFKYFALMLTSAYTGQYLIFLVNQLYILLKTSKMPHILVNLQTDAE
ncbi:uncharacterized protein LOC132795059 isoform X5 [Drosophila nasuta]|nr:uncharacterized protein LOC132795059 isoform X5 [Drosophila nasuta]